MKKFNESLLNRIKMLKDDNETITVDVWFHAFSEIQLANELSTSYSIDLDAFENEERYEKETCPKLLDSFFKTISKEEATLSIKELTETSPLFADALTNNSLIKKIQTALHLDNSISEKTIYNYIQKGKKLSDLFLLSKHREFMSARRNCVRKLIENKIKDIFSTLSPDKFRIVQENHYVPVITVKASVAELKLISNLDDVVEISLFENKKASPCIKTTSSNQTKLNIETTKNNGYDGSGIKIGVIEAVELNDDVYLSYNEGIDTSFNHLEDADITWIPYSLNSPSIKLKTSDHATYVTSIIVGQQKTTWFKDYEGVVPAATVIGTSCHDSSSFRNALNLMLENNVDIINLSLGFLTVNEYSSEDQYLDNFIASNNITVVVAAGNYHPEKNPSTRVSSPGHAYNAITVGNADSTTSAPYTMNVTSGYDQSNCTWETNKPDLCASGTDIVLSKNATATIDAGSGTSYATPYVTGVIAQMFQANSSIKNNYVKIKAILAVASNSSSSIISSSNDNSIISDSSILCQRSGAGFLDASVAVNLASAAAGSGVVLDLSTSYSLGQLFRYSAASMTKAGQKIRVAICFNKPENSPLSSAYQNNIDLKLYHLDDLIATSDSTKNNLEMVEYTSSVDATYNMRGFLTSYISSSTTKYLKVAVVYRNFD